MNKIPYNFKRFISEKDKIKIHLTESESLRDGVMEDPNFLKWFNGSKAVDEDGNPTVMFHGTQSDEHFTVFSVDGIPFVEDDDAEEESIKDPGSGADPNAFMGAHFAQEPEVASKFAIADLDWLKNRSAGRNGSGKIYPVFLRITNPAIFKGEDDLNDFIYSQDIDSDYVENAMYNLQEDGNDFDDLVEEYENNEDKRLEINMYAMSLANNMSDNFDMVNHPVEFARELGIEARKKLMNSGYDGVKYKNDIEGGISWIAFKPNQIKSVFSKGFSDNDDIMKEGGSYKKTKLFEVFEPDMPDVKILKTDKETKIPSELVFKTDKGNIVNISLSGNRNVLSIDFKVNGSYSDQGNERDADVISGLLGVMQDVAQKYKINRIVFIGYDDLSDVKYKPSFMNPKGIEKPKTNRRESIYKRLINRFFGKEWDIKDKENHISIERKNPIDINDIEDTVSINRTSKGR